MTDQRWHIIQLCPAATMSSPLIAEESPSMING